MRIVCWQFNYSPQHGQRGTDTIWENKSRVLVLIGIKIDMSSKNCWMLADDSHEISCLICYFWKIGKIWNCRLLQIIGGALGVSVLQYTIPGLDNSLREVKMSWQSLSFGITKVIHMKFLQWICSGEPPVVIGSLSTMSMWVWRTWS